ncbi:MAG TPA: methionine--tRNA ligase [Acidimicrobiales bacterium]|nr:methionine--tRNA ligase [Acidimicrobiales bacterium]
MSVSNLGRFYITTPIYYVNDAPHVGSSYTTVIADALARWHRLLGEEVRLLTGTDEHGLKMQRAAEQQGVHPREMADATSRRFRDTWDALDIQYDDFIRTTEERHRRAVTSLIQQIYDNGDIELGSYDGLYCVSCEGYYAETELTDGDKCPIHKRPVEHFSEENYFFKLSRYQDRLLEYYAEHPEAVIPAGKRNEVLGFIRGGLNDISISRTSIDWGVPLPWDDKHVVYVWFEALMNYCTAAGLGNDDPAEFVKWWPADVHVIGKDILRFHAVWWPAMCMSAGIEPPKQVAIHGFLLVGGEKLSKSNTNVTTIPPTELVAEFGIDGVRYHLLRDTPFGPDGDFSYEGMVERFNADLANNFGNLGARVAAVVTSKCGGVGPSPRADSPLRDSASRAVADTSAAWQAIAPSEALEATWQLIRDTNAYLESNEPWKMEPGAAVDAVMGDALEALRIVCVLASPAIPHAARALWARLGLDGAPEDVRVPGGLAWGGYPGGLTVNKGEPLFPRLQTK